MAHMHLKNPLMPCSVSSVFYPAGSDPRVEKPQTSSSFFVLTHNRYFSKRSVPDEYPKTARGPCPHETTGKVQYGLYDPVFGSMKICLGENITFLNPKTFPSLFVSITL